MGSKKTAWHPPFTGLLQERAPRWAKVTGEVQLTSEPLRVDDVIEVWADQAHDPSDVGTTLRGLWRYVVVVCLLEYKSRVWPFQYGDLYRLFAYGMLWLAERQQRRREGQGARAERLAAHEVTLALVVPSINPALRDELEDLLRVTLAPSETGYTFVESSHPPLVVVDLGVVAEREDDDVLRWFAGHPLRTLAAHRWVGQHQHVKEGAMSTQATPDLEGYDEWAREYFAQYSPEQRIAGLSAKEVVDALPAEALIAALPPEVLSALSDEYIATLSPATQAKVRAARGH